MGKAVGSVSQSVQSCCNFQTMLSWAMPKVPTHTELSNGKGSDVGKATTTFQKVFPLWVVAMQIELLAASFVILGVTGQKLILRVYSPGWQRRISKGAGQERVAYPAEKNTFSLQMKRWPNKLLSPRRISLLFRLLGFIIPGIAVRDNI